MLYDYYHGYQHNIYIYYNHVHLLINISTLGPDPR